MLGELTLHSEQGPTALCFLTAPFADFFRKQTFINMVQDKEVEFVELTDSFWENKKTPELKVRFITSPDGKRKYTIDASYFFSPEDGWVCCGKRYHLVGDPPSKNEDMLICYGPKGTQSFGDLTRIEKWRRDETLPKKFFVQTSNDHHGIRALSAFP